MKKVVRCSLAHVIALLAVASTAQAARTSTDVYESRAFRVDRASSVQSALAPVASNAWSFGEEIPYSARQADLVLKPGESLAAWFPSATSATSTSGSRTYIDRMPQVDLSTKTVTLDRYHRLESYVSLQVLVGASESGYWIGSLPTGDYDFVLNDWSLPGLESTPGLGLAPPSLTTPWQLDLPNATLAGTTTWAFSVVPEPSTGLLALLVLPAAIGLRR